MTAHQQSLWDTPPHPDSFGGEDAPHAPAAETIRREIAAEAHARRADPATSHAAAASLTPDRLRASQAEVLNLLRQGGPMCDQAIDAAALVWHTKQSTSGLRTRRRELVDAGLVEDSGLRDTLPSGRKSVVWRLTPKGRNHGR